MNKNITKVYPIYVLCLEDDSKDAELFKEMLHDSGFLVKMDIVSNEEQFISFLKAGNYDVILADYSLPGFDAPAALKHAGLLRPEVPLICVSGTIGEDMAVELLKQGATDYVLKDRIGRLAFAVQRALEESKTKKEWKKAQAELQEKEDEIKESELRYKHMFENNPQPMWIYDLDTLKFLEVNHAAMVHYGYSREEFLSMTLKDIRPKEDIDALIKDLELTRRVYNSIGEWRHLKKNGELIYVEVVSYYIVYGNIQARHVMVTDITDRKKAEETLRLSENHSAFLAQTAFELVELSSIQEIYKYTVQKLYDLLEGNSIVTLVEYDYSKNHWKMQQIMGVGKKAAKLSRLLGFDVNSMEGDISTKYYEQISSGKVKELDFDFPNLFNNKLSAAIGSAVKKMFSIEKLYCIAFQQNDHTIGNITFTTNKNSQPINTKLIETFIHQVSDFVKKQKAEELLKESEERFKALHNASFGGIAIHDNRLILECNQGLSEITGYSIDELIGMDSVLLIAPETRDMVINNTLASYEKPYEAIGLRKNGELFPIRMEARNIPYKGKAARIFEFRDITESKKAEDELIKLSRAVEQSPVSILITDIKGNIEYVNTKALTLTGYRFEELKGENPRIFSSGKKSKKEYRILWETILSGKEWRGELNNKKKNGELYWEYASISAIKNKMGHITHFLGVKEDITERKQGEKVLRELEIARKTARFKQNFLANMSHEIRTPLTGVLGMIDILELTHLNEDQQDYVNTIKASGENLKEIINQVLDYSKIEAGKIQINPVDFEFQSILQNAGMLYRNITRPEVKVITHMDPDIPRFIRTDKSRLSQVVNNLVSNALKFTHEGSVSVQARLISRITEKQQLKIEIKVVDTGIGIPVHLQEKLFSPFSQIDDNDTRHYEGTGLGLSICKQLVELFGGEIGVESDSNKGSTFWFTFTAHIAEHQQEKNPLHHKYTTHQSLHILLTEDKVVIQKVVSLMIKALGHTVTIANNGAQAIELYESGKFDLILMDIQMPVMNGITATQILKEKYTDLPPVIGLSANSFEGDREKYMALGMDEYLAKPVQRDDFREMLHHFFSGEMEPDEI